MIKLAWWIRQLSMTITEFAPGKGFIQSRVPSINCVKDVWVKDPSTMSTLSMPSRESAGRTEYLQTTHCIHIPYHKELSHLFPHTKKALRMARCPRMAHALPRYDVHRSKELSSTNTS